MRTTRRTGRFDSINVIPLIDIMLILFTIVLLSATFIVKGNIPIDLPSANAKGDSDKESVVITFDKEGKFYFDDKALSSEELKSKIETLDKDSHVILRGDKAGSFEKFIFIVDLLKGKAIESLLIETKEQ